MSDLTNLGFSHQDHRHESLKTITILQCRYGQVGQWTNEQAKNQSIGKLLRKMRWQGKGVPFFEFCISIFSSY